MNVIEHLTNIIIDIDALLKDNKYKFVKDDVLYIKNNIQLFKKCLENKDIYKIELNALKEVSNKVYELNAANLFSTLTDHISNELYAFEFILQEELRKKM